MASILKRKKLSEDKQQARENEVDRISNLPSNLICHILSFLPIKYAVRTSILSNRWKRHWTSITNIDIETWSIFRTSELSDKMKMNFVNIVYRVLLLCRVAHMHKFRLICEHDYDISHVDAWVEAALARNVQEFDFKIPLKGPGFLSSDLFTCKNLVVLKLGTGFVLNVPNYVFLRSLKTLHLHEIQFLNDESLNRLFLGCPLLEELTMEGNVGKNVGVIKISAPSLKRLIINCLVGGVYEDLFEYKIEFDTPNLVYLQCFDYLSKSYSVRKLNHLVRALAYFYLEDDAEDNFLELIPIYRKAVTDFLEAVSNVHALEISGDFMKVIEMCNPQLPIFHHVTSLEFCVNTFEWKKLVDLLQRMPHLDTLVFQQGLRHDSGDTPDWYPPQNVPSCSLCCLKVIKIRSFQGIDVEIEIVKYLLKNAKVLKKLTLYHLFTTQKKELKLLKKLLMLPRESKCCQVDYIGDSHRSMLF